MIPNRLKIVGEKAGEAFYQVANQLLSKKQMGFILLGMAYRCMKDAGENVDIMITFLQNMNKSS